MARKVNNPFSHDTFLSVLGILAGLCAAVFDQWAARTIFVFLGMALIIYAGRRHDSHPLLRYPVAAVALAVFAFLPWASIWADFHKDYPTTACLEFIIDRRYQGALALVSILALLWNWPRFWGLRHRVTSGWRTLLGEEENWVGREDALKIIRTSDWAKLKVPAANNIAVSLARAFGGQTVEREELEFKVYIDLTLDNFERDNPSYVRQQESKKEYLEQKLILFLRKDAEVAIIKKFGPVPTGQI
jgi:hypothetical protein